MSNAAFKSHQNGFKRRVNLKTQIRIHRCHNARVNITVSDTFILLRCVKIEHNIWPKGTTATEASMYIHLWQQNGRYRCAAENSKVWKFGAILFYRLFFGNEVELKGSIMLTNETFKVNVKIMA